MTDLGGHCMETLVEAFDAAQDDVPTLFIAWTVKGFGLPFAGHKDNHAGLMNPTQAHALRDSMGIAEGEEWEPLAGIGANARPGVEALIERSRGSPAKSATRSFGTVVDPRNPRPARRRAVDPGRVRPHPARPRQVRRIRSPTASSPPRPTSPSRPTSAPGSTSAACSSGAKWRTFSLRQRLHRRKNGRRPIKASTSSWASPNPICS